MGKIVNGSDFFKRRIETTEELNIPREPKRVREVIRQEISLDPAVANMIRKSVVYLKKLGLDSLATQIEETRSVAEKNRFSVAVVGEFSKGKSTFLNRFLGGDFLPVANLPTTAILTHIRYHNKPVLVHFDENGKKQSARILSEEAWDDLTADNFTGNDPTGTALVGINNAWLKENNIELLDTPGAGDLEASRAKVIGDALLGADGAIITVSATAVLSMSEKLFIEQRLLTRKTPYLMLILTKLDQVAPQDRNQVIHHVLQKLSSWDMEIPVYIPYDVELPNDEYAEMVGMDKIRTCMEKWCSDPERIGLTNQWVLEKTASILTTAKGVLREKIQIIDADVEQQEEIIKQKLFKLGKADIAWEDFRLEMLKRSNVCYQEVCKKAEDLSVAIVERLQYESSMAGSPQKWWKESYPYRLKIELTNLAAAIDNMASRIIASDAKWLSNTLDHHFKTSMGYDKEIIADSDMFGDMKEGSALELKNLEKQRNIAKVGSTVLSLAAAMVLAQTGGFVLLATMGVGTGASLISDKIFKKKIEEQRQSIKDAIAKNVPEIIDAAMCESEKRLLAVYDSIIKEAGEKKETWLAAQREAIVMVRKSDVQTGKKELLEQLDELNILTDKITELYNV